MRLSVRQQLSFVLILSGCVGLAVLAIATWVTNHNFVISVSSSRLEVTASLKAAQIAFNLEIMQTAAAFVTTRVLIQDALAKYNNGTDTTDSNWSIVQTDLDATLGDVGALTNAFVLQAMVFPRNASGPAGLGSVLNATGKGVQDIQLPWLNPDGTQAYLGEGPMGYPPSLYPNFTRSGSLSADEARMDGNSTPYVAAYNGLELGANDTLVLGPIMLNATFSLISMTLPVVNSTLGSDVLGYITVVSDARLIQMVIQDTRGLGTTGVTLLVGPTNTTNLFSQGILNTDNAASSLVRFLIPLNDTSANRHPGHTVGTLNPPFPASEYPAIQSAMENFNRGIEDFGTSMRTHNEEDELVSVGYSTPPTDLVDWIVLVEQARGEVWAPINKLRDIILACLFGVAGFLLVVSFPIAHWFVLPIRRLRAATLRTTETPSIASSGSGSFYEKCGSRSEGSPSCPITQRTGIIGTLIRWRHKYYNPSPGPDDNDGKPFRIPGKVKARKPWIKDEMSDLIKTFNEMSDELLIQYTKLDDKVRERTIELEQSKKAAEAANESKTLFVANVSHELKTPLNGILGMSAVAMEEEDPQKLKTSLGIIYKSGDLLLRTLSDLLTFSTNQVGHQVLKLDEKDFTLRDLEAQVLSIFQDQARDRDTQLRVDVEEPLGDVFGISGSLRDAVLWGDVHRILQVIINLVSNALKFTPAGGSVTVVIRSLSETPLRRGSLALARTMSTVTDTRRSGLVGSVSNGTANFINPHEARDIQEKVAPPAGRDFFVEFEVTDTGEGIPEGMQHKIFEPFIQGDSGLSRKHSGTGLGLSICSQLATLMRGSISLKSRMGQGSTFTAKIPLRHVKSATPKTSLDSSRDDSREGSRVPSRRTSLSSSLRKRSGNGSPVMLPVIVSGTTPADASQVENEAVPIKTAALPISPRFQTTPLKQAVKNASKEAKTKKESQSDFSHVRVLVAEDNKVNQEVILRMLKLEHIHDVTIAEDGQVALDLIKTQSAPAALDGSQGVVTSSYDLIFMDVQMPNMDGLTSTKLIREHGFKRPIVALTAYAEQANIDECYGSGMDYFLAKPIRRPQLKKVLTEYCTPSPLADKAVDASTDATHKAALDLQSEGVPNDAQDASTSQTTEVKNEDV